MGTAERPRPDGILDELFDNNLAWARAKTEQDPTFFRRLAEQQAPRETRARHPFPSPPFRAG